MDTDWLCLTTWNLWYFEQAEQGPVGTTLLSVLLKVLKDAGRITCYFFHGGLYKYCFLHGTFEGVSLPIPWKQNKWFLRVKIRVSWHGKILALKYFEISLCSKLLLLLIIVVLVIPIVLCTWKGWINAPFLCVCMCLLVDVFVDICVCRGQNATHLALP